MSSKDEITEELQRIKEEYAAKFDYDLAAMVHDLQRGEVAEKARGRKFVSFPPRRCRSEFLFTPLAKEDRSSTPPIGALHLGPDGTPTAHAQ